MITLYSGTPGSGKSFHAAERIFYLLRGRKNVICNIPINEKACKQNLFHYWVSKILRKEVVGRREIGHFIYKNNMELTPAFLIEYAKKNHNRKKEGQTTVVIDECGIMFNPRTFSQSDRLEWIQFFSLHRHYGYNFILISQSDRMIDRQIRSFVEYEHRHRKANNFGLGGMILHLLTMSTFFVDVKLWYGLREKVGVDWIRYSGRIASVYDTMYLGNLDDEPCDTSEQEEDAPTDTGDEGRGGPVPDGAVLSPAPAGMVRVYDNE